MRCKCPFILPCWLSSVGLSFHTRCWARQNWPTAPIAALRTSSCAYWGKRQISSGVIALVNDAVSDKGSKDLRLSGRTPAGSSTPRTAGRQHCGGEAQWHNLVCVLTSKQSNFTEYVYPTLRAISPSASHASSFSSMYAFSTLNLHKRSTRQPQKERLNNLTKLQTHTSKLIATSAHPVTSWTSDSASSSRESSLSSSSSSSSSSSRTKVLSSSAWAWRERKGAEGDEWYSYF